MTTKQQKQHYFLYISTRIHAYIYTWTCNVVYMAYIGRGAVVVIVVIVAVKVRRS